MLTKQVTTAEVFVVKAPRRSDGSPCKGWAPPRKITHSWAKPCRSTEFALWPDDAASARSINARELRWLHSQRKATHGPDPCVTQGESTWLAADRARSLRYAGIGRTQKAALLSSTPSVGLDDARLSRFEFAPLPLSVRKGNCKSRSLCKIFSELFPNRSSRRRVWSRY